jgi:uncharacterized protein
MLLFCFATSAFGLFGVYMLRVYYGSRDAYVRTNILSVLSRVGLLPTAMADTEVGRALQWSHKAVHAPFVRHGDDVKSRKKYTSRVCNMTTTKGVHLEGELWSPEGLENTPLPCVLMRTPYGHDKKGAKFLVSIFFEEEYHVYIQSARGRFGSGGDFFPIMNEKEDGGECIKWLKDQSFCNGKVGAYGVSYLGLTSWAAAGNEAYGNQLDAFAPVLATSRLFPIFKAPNGSKTGPLSVDLALRWLYLVLNLQMRDEGRDGNLMATFGFLYNLFISSPPLDRALLHLPLEEADSLVTLDGAPVQFFQDAIRNMRGDEPFWEDKDMLFDLEKVGKGLALPPVHIIGGWYDFFVHQQLEDYTAARSRAYSNPNAVSLTVGNFSHWSFASYIPIAKRVVLEWFDIHLKGNVSAGNGNGLPVRLFVMQKFGVGKWISLPDWPPPTVEKKELFLSLDNTLQYHLEPNMDGVEQYVYDPRDPTPSVGGPSFDPSNAGPRDQRRFENRKDVVVFTTSELKEEVEICGYPRLVLYVSTDAASTDFVGRLCDVFPNGMSVNVCDGLVRIEGGLEAETTPGRNVVTPLEGRDGRRVFRLSFEIGATAYSFLPGHRIRVQVCSGAHGRWMRNFGNGSGEIHNTLELKAQSQQVLIGSKEYPSRLVLPRTDLFEGGAIAHSSTIKSNL